MTPAISVIACNYNYGRFLEQCLNGMLRQTFTDFEIVITDDGSTDGSQDIIRKYAAKDSRVKPNYFPENRGAMVATQDIWSRAQGTFVFGEGTDDFIIDKDYFARAMRALQAHPQSSGYYAVTGIFSAEKNKTTSMMGSAPKEGYLTPSEFYRGFLRGEVFVPGSSCIWKRELMQAIGGFDYDFGPQIDFLLNHSLPMQNGVVFERVPVACMRTYENSSNYGSKSTLWSTAARLARVEERLKSIAPSYETMEEDWKLWRARWMVDAIQKSGIKIG